MKAEQSGQRGFTLIELLIVVAILGILAAVVIPNVGRFLGRGQEEARRTEFQNVAASVTALMVENKISSIPNPSGNIAPCTAGTKEMNSFPDSTSIDTDGADPGTDIDKAKDPVTGTAYDFLAPGVDKAGYLLYTHDITADALLTPTTNYVSFNKSTYCYKADRDGTIHQYNEAGTEQLN